MQGVMVEKGERGDYGQRVAQWEMDGQRVEKGMMQNLVLAWTTYYVWRTVFLFLILVPVYLISVLYFHSSVPLLHSSVPLLHSSFLTFQ